MPVTTMQDKNNNKKQLINPHEVSQTLRVSDW
jgi:hypothetical protein